MPNKIIDIERLERFLVKIKEYIEELLSSKQDALTNGVTIKTVNGESILGAGNIIIGHKPLVETTSTNIQLSPNIYYRQISSSPASLTFSLETASNQNILNEYFVEFTTGTANTTVAFPATIKWNNGEIPTFEPGYTYQVSIVNNLALVAKFK
jgi:hypothetical protein